MRDKNEKGIWEGAMNGLGSIVKEEKACKGVGKGKDEFRLNSSAINFYLSYIKE